MAQPDSDLLRRLRLRHFEQPPEQVQNGAASSDKSLASDTRRGLKRASSSDIAPPAPKVLPKRGQLMKAPLQIAGKRCLVNVSDEDLVNTCNAVARVLTSRARDQGVRLGGICSGTTIPEKSMRSFINLFLKQMPHVDRKDLDEVTHSNIAFYNERDPQKIKFIIDNNADTAPIFTNAWTFLTNSYGSFNTQSTFALGAPLFFDIY